MLLLNINRKSYMGSPVTLSHLTLGDLERSISRSLRYQRLIYHKAAELRHILLLKINKKHIWLDFSWFSLQQWVFDTCLQKIPNAILTVAVKQSANVHGPLVFHFTNVGTTWSIVSKRHLWAYTCSLPQIHVHSYGKYPPSCICDI